MKCPECGRTIPPANRIILVGCFVCRSCGGISLVEDHGGKQSIRVPKTQEWHDLFCKGMYNDVWDIREQVLDRLTHPEPGKVPAPHAHAR